MTHRKISVLLVLGLGVGLHLGFRGLAGELPQMFPHITNETPVEAVPPIRLLEITPEGKETLSAVALKRSGEESPFPADFSDERPLSSPRKLLRTSPIPLVPIPPAGEWSGNFDVSADLKPAVDFWRRIYTLYNTHEVVLHDSEHLEIEYGVLDFGFLEEKEVSESDKSAIKQAAIEREMDRIRGLLTELEERIPGQGRLSKEAKRIEALFRPFEDEDKYKVAEDSLRSQVGLKKRFTEGVRNSGRYLTLFEEIFQNYGIPIEITRLAFVESLFKERALSKVGAAGLWQFMPGTAQRYMTIDRLVDERYDPIIATHGAARLLLKNYDLLGSWPLAINAYNSGPGNLLKAIRQLGTRDIGTIIRKYRTGSYAFASRNFYPQFLAALDGYENHETYLGRIEKEPVLEFDAVTLPTTMGFPEIAYLSDVSLQDLQELNPSFAPVVFTGNYSMPAGSQIRIPLGAHERFSVRFVQYFQGSPSPLFHVVSTGESLREIASRYGIHPSEIQRTNRLEGRLQSGRVLLIPHSTTLGQSQVSF